MPQSTRIVDAPNISPLRKPYGLSQSQIYTDTYIEITTCSPDHKVYFSTDGRDPDPWRRMAAGEERTFKYRGPFRLRTGPRQVKAMAVSRRDRASSRVTTKAFDVIDAKNHHSIREDTDEADNSSTLVSLSSSTMETSDPDLIETPDTRGPYRRRGVPDTSRSVDSFGKESRLEDMERNRKIYKEILDSTYIDELNEHRQNDADLTAKYLGSGYTSAVSDVDSYFDESYHRTGDATYGRKIDDSFDDMDTEVSNYFRSSHTGSNRLASRSPVRTMYKGTMEGDPPGFWSTATPRVHFTDTDLRRMNNPTSASLNTDYKLRLQDPLRHSYSGADTQRSRSGYNSAPKYTGADSFRPNQYTNGDVLSRQTVTESYRSPYRGSEDAARTYTPRNRITEPLGDIGYEAGYNYGSGNLSDSEKYNGHQAADKDAVVEKLDKDTEKKEKKKNKCSDASDEENKEPKSEDESDVNKKGKKKKKKKKKKKESEDESDQELKSEDESDGEKKRKKNKKKSKKKDSEDESDQEEDKKKEKMKKKDDHKEDDKSKKDKYNEDNEKEKKKDAKDSADEDEDTENKKKMKDRSDDSEDGKKKDKKKKDKDNDSDDGKKKDKKKKKKKDKDSDSEDDKKKKDKDKKKDKKDKVPQTMTKNLETKDGAFSFVNDSGTQINFWGSPPDDVVKKVGDMIVPRGQATSAGTASLVQAMPYQSGPGMYPQSQPALAYPTNTSSSYPPGASTEPAADSPITRVQHQQEQHSVGGFFKKLFGIDKKKNKKEDPRTTVREVGSAESSDKVTYEMIRRECLSKGTLWEDPDFPAEDSSVYVNENPVEGDIEWKRPHEICSNPNMFVGGASRFDVKQGVLGNCWLLAAVASLTTNDKLLNKVVPAQQNFTDQYAGVFRFKFYQYGRWVEVCVDDRLPTSEGQLAFMHSEEGNEFWSPLMEKAYAKLCGCYENLSGGLTSEAMTDFTGGVTERFNFREELPDNLFQMMLKAYQRKSLMGCSIDAEAGEIEQELDNGLIIGHAYSITAVKVLKTDDGEENLVRVRNPWGNECEWTGAWSDQSDEWNDISEDVKKSMGLQFYHDGEFWMSFKDFSTHFQRMEICHLSPDSLGSDDGSTLWTSSILNGAWKKNVSAGGCRNFPKTYYTNPQFRIQITDADDDDEEDIGTIIVALMQCGRRKLRAGGGGNLTMGYEIFNTDGKKNKKTLGKSFFKKAKPVTTSAYINMREVCTRHRLPPGEYCIVVTTFEAGEEADFMLRIYSEKPGELVEMDEDTSVVQAQDMSVTQSAPNPGLTREAEKQFERYGGDDEEIDAYELKDVLNKVFTKDFEFSGFDLNLCRSMLAMKDADYTGKLALDEFKEMWKQLNHWKTVFKKFDEDKSGLFSSCELREALKHCGFQVSNSTFQSVVMRFSDKHGNITFDDFVGCVVKLSTMFSIFSNQIKDGQASFSLDDFVQMTIYS